MEENEQDKTSQKVVLERDEHGRILPGQPSLNPEGRPKGSFSIKERLRQRLEANPNELNAFLDYFALSSRELGWQMLEGRPQMTVDQTVHVDKFEIIDGDYRPISGTEIPLAEENSEGMGQESI